MHVEASRESDVAHIRLPWRPWRTARAETERNTVLRNWIDLLPRAFFRKKQGWRQVCVADLSDYQLHEGAWALVLHDRDQTEVPTILDDVVQDDAEMAALRRHLKAEVLVVSWPDDIEWSLCIDPTLTRRWE